MIEELYKKKVIRDFLSLFSESKWKEVVFLSLEYGVLLLKKNFNVASLSLDDLNTILDDLKEEENKRIKQNLKKFEISTKNKTMKNKPSSEWRKGDDVEETKEQSHLSLNKYTRCHTQPTLEKIIKNAALDNKNLITNTNANANIYPKWWTQMKSKTNSTNLNNRSRSKHQSNLKSGNKNSNRSDCNISYDLKKNSNLNGYNSDTSKSKIFNSKQIEMIKYSNAQNRQVPVTPQHFNSNNYFPQRDRNAPNHSNISNPHFDKKKVQQTESKIKSKVDTDKKIYSLLQKRNFEHTNSEVDYDKFNYEDPDYYSNEDQYKEKEDSCYRQTERDSNYYPEEIENYKRQNQFMNVEGENENISTFERKDFDENSVINNVSYLKDCEGSFQNEQSNQYREAKNKDIETQKSNWAIEYDKDLKPQIIKEKDDREKKIQLKQYPNNDYQITKNYSHLDKEYNQEYPHEQYNYSETSARYQDQTHKTPIGTQSNEATSHRKNASSLSTYSRRFPSDSPYGALNTGMTNMTNNRNPDDTFLREQTINNYINSTYKKENPGSSRVVSPHFGRNQNFFSSNEENDINQRSQMEEPFTIQNDNIVSPDTNFHMQCQNSKNSKNSENSDKLSSYTPSERTKMYFRGENRGNLNESSYSRNRESLTNSLIDRERGLTNIVSYENRNDFHSYSAVPGRLDEKEVIKYNSSMDDDEGLRPEIKSSFNIEEIQNERENLHSLKTNTLTTNNTAADFKDFNKTAEDLNNRIKKLLNKNN